MADLALIQGAITGLKTAGDIAKGILELRSLSEVQGKVIDLQSAILSAQSSALAAQSEQSTMIQRIRELEEEIARVKAWEETKQRYSLISPWQGGFVYARKRPQGEPTEPPHWICTKCYEDGRKSVLQYQHGSGTYGMQIEYHCPNCKTVLSFLATQPLPVEYIG